MPSEPDLRPVSPDDLASAFMFALRFDGRKRVHSGDEMMARITAERLIEHLHRSGFVVMRRPARVAPGLPDAGYRK